jgi:hypothetical protein
MLAAGGVLRPYDLRSGARARCSWTFDEAEITRLVAAARQEIRRKPGICFRAKGLGGRRRRTGEHDRDAG